MLNYNNFIILYWWLLFEKKKSNILVRYICVCVIGIFNCDEILKFNGYFKV